MILAAHTFDEDSRALRRLQRRDRHVLRSYAASRGPIVRPVSGWMNERRRDYEAVWVACDGALSLKDACRDACAGGHGRRVARDVPTSTYGYRRGVGAEQAPGIVPQGAGSRFDPGILAGGPSRDALLAAYRERT